MMNETTEKQKRLPELAEITKEIEEKVDKLGEEL